MASCGLTTVDFSRKIEVLEKQSKLHHLFVVGCERKDSTVDCGQHKSDSNNYKFFVLWEISSLFNVHQKSIISYHEGFQTTNKLESHTFRIPHKYLAKVSLQPYH